MRSTDPIRGTLAKALALAGAMLIASCAAARAERVVLKNGSAFTGQIVSEDERSLVLKTDIGLLTLSTRDIARVEGRPTKRKLPTAETDDPLRPPKPTPEPSRPKPPDPQPGNQPGPQPETTPEPAIDRPPETDLPVELERPVPAPDPGAVPAGTGTEFPGGGPRTPANPNDPTQVILDALKQRAGKPDAALTLGLVLAVLAAVIAVSFVIAILVAWGVAHALKVADPSFVNALKVVGVQWGVAFVLLGFLIAAAVMLPAAAGAGAGASGSPAPAGPLGAMGAVAACGSCVGLVLCVVVNVWAIMRIFDLGLGRSILFLFGQGILGLVANAVVNAAGQVVLFALA